MTTEHPAPWNRKALSAAADRVAEILGERPVRILDPFAGVGRVHELRDRGFETVGGELEIEWAEQHEGTIVANALAFPEADGSFDAVITSPTWGNRMADHHVAKDPCRTCGGDGYYLDQHPPDFARITCPKCKGTGLTVRHTYRHKLGRMPTSGSSAVLAFGRYYRIFHHDWIVEARRLLVPGEGVLVVNVANHIKDDIEVDVVGWWLGALVGEGFYVRAVDWIEAGKIPHGANAEKRVVGELNIVCQTRP